MGISGSTDLVAKTTEAKHAARVKKWKDEYLAQPPEAAEDYIALHSAWWCRLIELLGLNDELLGAKAARDERRKYGG